MPDIIPVQDNHQLILWDEPIALDGFRVECLPIFKPMLVECGNFTLSVTPDAELRLYVGYTLYGISAQISPGTIVIPIIDRGDDTLNICTIEPGRSLRIVIQNTANILTQVVRDQSRPTQIDTDQIKKAFDLMGENHDD